MPVIRDAIPADAKRIGEAHAEAWRVAYEGLFPAGELAAAVDVRRRTWVGLVGPGAPRQVAQVSEVGCDRAYVILEIGIGTSLDKSFDRSRTVVSYRSMQRCDPPCGCFGISPRLNEIHR